jgi:hypothetical protein
MSFRFSVFGFQCGRRLSASPAENKTLPLLVGDLKVRLVALKAP